MDPRDRVVLVTGASMGIGEAVARAFAAHGARLVLAARSRERLEALVREIGPDRALALPTDLQHREQAAALVDQTIARFGRLDILVNNAGVGLFSPVAEMDIPQCQAMFALNFFAPIYLVQAAVPHMKKQGEGQIINISSVAGKIAIPGIGGYSATKFALWALTDSLRVELRPEKIHVIGVYPGRVKTPFVENAYGNRSQRRVAVGLRGISAEAVAAAVLRASRYDQRSVVVPPALWLAVGLHRLLPGFSDWVMGRMMK